MSHTGPAIVPASAVRSGTMLMPDGGFSCMRLRRVKRVKKGRDGLYVTCNEGRHYLNGQLSEDGRHYVGFWLCEPTATINGE